MKALLALLLFALPAFSAELTYLGGRVWNVDELKIKSNADLKKEGLDLIFGKVIQSANGGALILVGKNSTRDEFTTIFIENSGRVVDDEKFGCYAVESGVFEYTTVLGAKKTVRKFIAELKPTAEQVKTYNFLRELELRASAAAAEKQRADEEAARVAAQAKAREFEAMLAKGLAEQQATARAEQAAAQFATDAKTAAVWKRRADSGDAEAQFELANRYLAGKGVTRDVMEAKRLLNLASKQGHKGAAARLENMPKPDEKQP